MTANVFLALAYARHHLIPVTKVYAMSDDQMVGFCHDVARTWGGAPLHGVFLADDLRDALYTLHAEISRRGLWPRVRPDKF